VWVLSSERLNDEGNVAHEVEKEEKIVAEKEKSLRLDDILVLAWVFF